MRLRVAGLGRVVKRDFRIEFGREQLTSYGGLELLRRYFQSIGLNRRIRQGSGRTISAATTAACTWYCW